MSDSKKPKLSEIKAHYEGMVAKDPGAFYLLELVERLGEVLEKFGRGTQGSFCDQCSMPFQLDRSIDHTENCPIPEARALLKELEL